MGVIGDIVASIASFLGASGAVASAIGFAVNLGIAAFSISSSLGAGKLAENPEVLRTAVSDLLADDAALWRSMKRKLALHGRNSGAITAARHILVRCKDSD